MNRDKVYHMIAGGLLYLIGTIHSPLLGLMLVFLAGFGKEVLDYFGKGTPDGSDVVATLVGGLFVYSIGVEYVKLFS